MIILPTKPSNAELLWQVVVLLGNGKSDLSKNLHAMNIKCLQAYELYNQHFPEDTFSSYEEFRQFIEENLK